MPISMNSDDLIDEIYNETKHLRLNQTNKRLRRLRAFERIHYKKTFEVKKHGHNLDGAHCLNDGNLRYLTHNLTYSLNKKKRWLLPKLIEQRICENDSESDSLKNDQSSIVDQRLKIVMFENENTRHSSTCLRYGNSQTEPRILHKNGRRFNSVTLDKWINFNTRTRRDTNDDRVNQPNFGIRQRPGFFPSEVTYEFLYPKRFSSRENVRNGKTSLSYFKDPEIDNGCGRYFKDTTKNRRKVRRFECSGFLNDEEEYDYEEEDDINQYIIEISNITDEDENWSIVFEELSEKISPTNNYPIEYFIPSNKSSTRKNSFSSDKKIDYKSNKIFPSFEMRKSNEKEDSSYKNGEFLCSIKCLDESDFISIMQNSTTKNIFQANISPTIFVQRTSTSTYFVIYKYSRSTLTVDVTVQFTGLPPNLIFNEKTITIQLLIELITKHLNEQNVQKNNKAIPNTHSNVDALRGSLPLPTNISDKMILVRPKSINKQKALEDENLSNYFNQYENYQQWFDTTEKLNQTLECSICCENLNENDVYQLLPCFHIICYSCLISYIRTSVSTFMYSSTNLKPINCFQSNCSTELNLFLIQTFVSYEIYQTFIRTLIDRKLFSTGKYRKCPSRMCSDLLIVDEKTKYSLMCSCGQRVCNDCLEEYHFPATCQQYKLYLSRLRESSDDLLSSTKSADINRCYIAEGKNCPNCGEFVEKNGGCPHMTCRCGNEYCWTCLKPWASHNYSNCSTVPESTHELRSSTRNRLHNKAVNHRRQRSQYAFNLLSSTVRQSKTCSLNHDLILSTYVDLNTLAEFLYVVLQRRRTDVNIRAVLSRTANRLESDAFRLNVQIQSEQFKQPHIDDIRLRLERTVASLSHMKKNKILL